MFFSSDLVPMVTKAYMDHSYGVSCDTLGKKRRRGEEGEGEREREREGEGREREERKKRKKMVLTF